MTGKFFLRIIIGILFLFKSASLRATDPIINPGLGPKDMLKIGNISFREDDDRLSLSDVIAKLGKVKKLEAGDSSCSWIQLCYSFRSGERIMFIEGETNDEIALSDGELETDLNRKCECRQIDSSSLFKPIFANGLKLGMTRAEVKLLVNAVATKQDWDGETDCSLAFKHDDSDEYDWSAEKAEMENGGELTWTTDTRLNVGFRNGRASWIVVNRFRYN